METLQSTIFIEFDVNTKKITFLRGDNIIDYDSNVTNVYIRVKYKNLSGNTVYLTPSELEDYKFSLYTMKPATNNVNLITGEVTDELKENVYGGVVKFEIPGACTNRLGIVKCEIHINQGNKIIGSSTFVLDVKQSLVTAFDDELLGDEDFPVLRQLILEIQKASNIDDVHISKITTYSSDKVENIKENLSSQIKDIANNQIPEEYLQQNIDDYIENNNGGLTTKTEFNTLVESGLDSIIEKSNEYNTPFTTSLNISEYTNILESPSQAYANGYISTTSEELREIIFYEGTTSTEISIFVFNSSNTLISQQENLTLSGLKCILSNPINLSIGDYVLVRILDGESKYKRLSENSQREYQPGNGNIIDSPILLAFDIKTMRSNDVYKFKPLEDPLLNINDFITPKVVRLKDEGYTLLGRWFEKDSTFSECCNSAGASIMFKVKDATSVSINLNQIIHPSYPDYVMPDEPYFAYSIDGGDFIRVQIDSEAKNINIPSTDEHLVWIVVDGMCLNSGSANRNSGWSGVYIKSLTTDGKMYKVAIKNKQILFVGDSIVEGINTLGTDSTSSSNSCVNEFSFKTARKLNSIPLIQGYGGSTSWDGVDYTRYSLVDLKLDTFINIQEPDLILIEYGYNDNSVISVGGKTKEYFIEQYKLLINILKGKYSGVPIICMIPFKQSLREEIINIANLYNDCYVIETDSYEVTYSDSAHPNVEGAENASTELSKDILKIFGKQFFI